jgi:hypothetical protein
LITIDVWITVQISPHRNVALSLPRKPFSDDTGAVNARYRDKRFLVSTRSNLAQPEVHMA